MGQDLVNSIGLVGNPGSNCRVLPVLEIDYSRLDPSLPRLLTYESKWIPESPYWSQIAYREARLDQPTKSLRAFMLMPVQVPRVRSKAWPQACVRL